MRWVLVRRELEVAYNAHYPMGDLSVELLREAGVKVRQI